jgi:hypothetical protein
VASWDDIDIEAAPDWLPRLVELVLADLQQPRPVGLDWAYGRRLDGDAVLWLRETGEASYLGFWLLDAEPAAWFQVKLADWLQEQFFPETRAAWGEARPACPGHPHPTQAEEVAGEAWWVCPADKRRIALIGSL